MGLVALFAATLLGEGAARADVSSWLAVGGGYSLERNDVTKSMDRAAAFSASIGVGSSPKKSFVVGGILRSVTYFTLGTDLTIGPRFATGGFARGQWGVAFDACVGARWWGLGDYGRYPLSPVVTLGAPWGFQLGVGASLWNLSGTPYATGGFAVLEMDLLRLTVMRQGATDQSWFNASPAGGRDAK